MKKSGFTLPEMLVVIGVLSVAGFMILTIFTNALRGNNKSQILSSIKKNGQAALEAIDKNIRNSSNVVCVTPDITENEGTTLVVFNQDGIYTRYRFLTPRTPESPRNECMAPTDTVDKPTNGCIITDNPVKEIVNDTEETTAQFVNRVCGAGSLISAGFVILTDTKEDTGVSITNGSFKRDISAGYKENVTVRFKAAPPVGVPVSISGQIDPVEFATTVGLR